MKDGITKNQSKMLQGLAVLMMLYHHLFSTPEALGVQYFSILKFQNINIELHMAWFFKICVGIYAFLSGYGLCRMLLSVSDDSMISKLVSDFKCVLKKLWSFYIEFWIVFLIFVPIGFVFFNREFILKDFLLSFLGLSNVYNGAWWYIALYLKMLLTVPILDILFTNFKTGKENLKKAALFLALIVFAVLLYIIDKNMLLKLIDSFQPSFFLCFMMGYLISRFKLYELCYKIFPSWLLDILGITGLIAVIFCRVKIAKDASSAGLDFIFVPVFIFGFCILMSLLKRLSKLFSFFGKYSTFIWLTHVFFYDHYAKNIVMFPKVSILIYMVLLLLSTLTAIVLNKLLRIFKHLKIC